MQAYLAEKYMSGPKADAILARTAADGKSKKKKKRKADSTASTVQAGSSIIQDDDLSGFSHVKDAEDEDEEGAAPVVASDRGFKKRKTGGEENGWSTVREGVKKEETPPLDDERPQVVEPAKPFKGGLLSREQLKAALPGASSTTKEVSINRDDKGEAVDHQETVYRDASGRKIDMKAERAEAARKKREREAKEAERMEWGKGLVQREEAEKQKKQLETMKNRDFARRADDKEMNDALKQEDRWNDPAAAFLTKKKAKGPRRPEYTGPPPPPNRFGIKPGYRWDGVDRGNGFEAKLYQRVNERQRKGLESYQWSSEDM